MSEGYRGEHVSLRALCDALITGALVFAFAAFFIDFLATSRARRESVERVAEAQCTQSQGSACEGSIADIRAANAAEDMLDLTALQFLAGFAGLVLLALTLKATRDAVREAQDATEAAEEAVAVTREGMERQLRAYVTFKGVKSTPQRLGYHLSAEWKNGGTTPALRAVGSIIAKASKQRIPEDFSFKFTHLDVPGPVPIGPGESLHIDANKSFTLSDISAAHEGSVFLYLWGYIEYSDIFDRTSERHRTEFAMQVVPIMRGHSWAFDIRPLWRHNGMDADCLHKRIAISELNSA